MNCHWFCCRLIRILVLGLLLYVVDVALHITIASHYLDMRQCHRGIAHTFHDFSLNDTLDLDELLAADTLKVGDPAPDNNESNFFSEYLGKKFTYFEVREKLISLVPDHWERRIADIVEFQIGNYRVHQVSDMCTFNGYKFDNIIQVGNYICQGIFTTDEQREAFAQLGSNITDEQEQMLFQGLLNKDHKTLLKIAPDILGLNMSQKSRDGLEKIIANMTLSDLEAIGGFLANPEVFNNLPALMEAMDKIQQEDLDILGEAFNRIKKENIPLIDKLLSELNISFASFLTDPTLFGKFLTDPKLTAVLMELQELLPNFGPGVLNSMLVRFLHLVHIIVLVYV